MNGDREALLRLAGYALAHAAWSIEDGETLVTLAMVVVDGQRELVRYEADSIPESIDVAHADLREHLSDGGIAALVMDGYATPEGGRRTDALLVELFEGGAQPIGRLVQPYRAARRSRIPFMGGRSTFALLGEVVVAEGLNVPDAEKLVLEGARSHVKAAHLFRPDSP